MASHTPSSAFSRRRFKWCRRSAPARSRPEPQSESGDWSRIRSVSSRPGARAHYIHIIGRLKRGVTMTAAAADMTGVADRLARDSPSTNGGHGIVVETLRDALIGGEVRLTATVLLGVVGFVLLMCCANVANLLLARTGARARELAVRSALGAGRRRIAGQLLTESLVLALLGGVLGAAVGAAILRIVPGGDSARVAPERGGGRL